MDYYSEVCDNFIIPKSKNKPFKSNTHKGFDICKHKELTIEKPNIDDIVEVFDAYVIQYKKQYDHYYIKCHFKLLFIDNP